MSSVSFLEIKIDCVTLSLKHHYISLEHKNKCYWSKKYAISRSFDIMSLKTPRYQIKIPLLLCLSDCRSSRLTTTQ